MGNCTSFEGQRAASHSGRRDSSSPSIPLCQSGSEPRSRRLLPSLSWKSHSTATSARHTWQTDNGGSSSHSPFDSLPKEVLIQILASCPATQIPTLRHVCAQWRKAMADSSSEVSAVRKERGMQEHCVVVAACEGAEGDAHSHSHSPSSPRFSLRAFDCQSHKWGSIPVPKELKSLGPGFAVASLGHTLYVTGGSTGRSRAPTAYTWCYDRLTQHWESKSPMPFARKLHAMSAVSGRLVVAGGETPEYQDSCPSVVYDPPTDTWHEIPGSAVPCCAQEGWVVNSSLYIRHLPDRVFKITVPHLEKGGDGSWEQRLGSGMPSVPSDTSLSTSSSSSSSLSSSPPHLPLPYSPSPSPSSPSWLSEVSFEVSPYAWLQDPVLRGMDCITSSPGGKVYGCMLSGHLPSMGVFNPVAQSWHLLVGHGMEFHRILERFEGMVFAGGSVYVITRDHAILQVIMEDGGKGLSGPEWQLLSRGCAKCARSCWRQFASLEL